VRKTIFAILTVGTLVVGGTAAASPATDQHAGVQAFAHPGVLVTRAQLDNVKAKVAAGTQPWASAYSAMRASTFASLSYTPHPRAVVECGPSSNPNLGCSDERNDAVAAYTHALHWYITGDTRYAAKAVSIMDAWSAVIRDHTNHNARLQTGWAGASWTRAAELIRYTSTAWPTDRINRFATMLRNVYLPEIADGSPNTNGNWELIMTDAMIGIGVFLNDTTVFNRAITLWRGRVPAYIYLASDGPLPKSPPGSNKDTAAELIDYWQGQSRFVDGLAQETCRDFGHTGWGLDAATHIAETAWIQGVDLYAEMRTRMLKTLEFHANYDLGASVPSWLCGGSLNTGLGPTLEVAHNHYRNRTNTQLPKTLQLIQSRRPMGVSHFIAWETLTHAINP
jgi:hypothetical protein